MIENSIFIIISGIITVAALYIFNIKDINPIWILVFVSIFLIPGFYAMVTSGPYVPSSKKRHRLMLKLAEITSKDIVYDLGCGDGRLVFQAAKFAKKAIGYELSIPLVIYGNIKKILTFSKANIGFANIWKKDYQDANVIFCYLLPKAMKQFYKEVWPKLKPGTRVISNAFPMQDIKPDLKEGKVYVYIK